jgi:hypothetical protein
MAAARRASRAKRLLRAERRGRGPAAVACASCCECIRHCGYHPRGHLGARHRGPSPPVTPRLTRNPLHEGGPPPTTPSPLRRVCTGPVWWVFSCDTSTHGRSGAPMRSCCMLGWVGLACCTFPCCFVHEQANKLTAGLVWGSARTAGDLPRHARGGVGQCLLCNITCIIA